MDTNAISFHLSKPNLYFTIDTATYLFVGDLEADPSAGEPSFEFNDQINSQVGELENVLFQKKAILLYFQLDNPFLEKYRTVTIHLKDSIDIETVDFFSNSLFSGNYI